MLVDLHCHSHWSDGLLSPEEILNRAIAAKIQILSLTDHDTTEGLKRLHLANHLGSIQLINGIELSVRWKKYDVHILGLKIDLGNLQLERLIDAQQENRRVRARQIGQCLEACGVKQAYQKACELAGHERVGRLHFAHVLMQEGLVPDLKSAFKRFLGAHQKAYVPTLWVNLEEAVQSITQANGQAVIAHPLKYKLTRTKLHEFIKAFKLCGGAGIEVVSGDMTMVAIQEMAQLSVQFDLLASSGSDFHGDLISRVSLGKQKALPASCTPIWQKWRD